MIIGVVEVGNAGLADFFEEYLFEKVEGIVCKKKKAMDLFDALALLNNFSEVDELALIVEMIRSEREKNQAFLDALANFEATTGKTVIKCLFYEDEDGKTIIADVLDRFIEYAFKVKPEKEQKPEELPFI